MCPSSGAGEPAISTEDAGVVGTDRIVPDVPQDAGPRRFAGAFTNRFFSDKSSEAPSSAPEDVIEEKAAVDWVSPAYTVSRTVNIAPEQAIANRCIAYSAGDSPEFDSYRVLRTKLLQCAREKGGNAVMVTSAVPGEGKTLTALNLACTLAREIHQTVLLVDCDLRRQMIHRYLGYESDKGLIDYLLNDTPIPELITWPGIEKLTVISGGRSIAGSSELLGSPRMRDLVADMKTRYPERFIIFDVPPLLAGADALAFAPLADHIVVAVQEGTTSIHDVNRAMKLVAREKVLGLVLNRQRRATDTVHYSVRRS